MKSNTTVFSWTNENGALSDQTFRDTALKAAKDNNLELIFIGNYDKDITPQQRLEILKDNITEINGYISESRKLGDNNNVTLRSEQLKLVKAEKAFLASALDKGINLKLCSESNLAIPSDTKETMILSQGLSSEQLKAACANKGCIIKTYTHDSERTFAKEKTLNNFHQDVANSRRVFEKSDEKLPSVLADLNYYLKSGARFEMKKLGKKTVAAAPLADSKVGLPTFSQSVSITSALLSQNNVPSREAEVNGKKFLIIDKSTSEEVQKSLKGVYDKVYKEQPSRLNPVFQMGF